MLVENDLEQAVPFSSGFMQSNFGLILRFFIDFGRCFAL